jgi:hypothetical protein
MLAVVNTATTLGWFGRRNREHTYLKEGDVLLVREEMEDMLPEIATEDPRVVVMTSSGVVGWLFMDEVDLITEEDNDPVHQASPHRGGQERSPDPRGGADPEADR